MNGATFRLGVLAASIASVPLIAHSQGGQSPYPVVDQIADKVIAKYQSASCDELAAAKQNPPSGQKAAVEQKAMAQLKSDPQMRQYFINKVAAPVANKLFECGMIP